MEGGDDEMRRPLISGNGSNLVTTFSVDLLRRNFMLMLPDKILGGIDPENPSCLHLSRSSDIPLGTFYFLFLYNQSIGGSRYFLDFSDSRILLSFFFLEF